MTIITAAVQSKFSYGHVVADAGLYCDGKIVAFESKIATVRNWGVVTNAGDANAFSRLALEFAKRYKSLDSFVKRAPAELPAIVEECALRAATVLLVGISPTRGVESYTFSTDDSLPPGVTRAEAEASPYYAPPLTLEQLPAVIMTPTVPLAEVLAANFHGVDVDADPAHVIWSLHKHLEMQRATHINVGGFGECVTISPRGIVRRIIVRWPEDKPGTVLRPAPIDWARWHADNPEPKKAA